MAERERSPFGMVPRFKTLSNRNSVYAGLKRTKNMASCSVTEGKRAALFTGAANHLPSSITTRRSVIIPSFTSIARKQREEFANRGFELYQNICN